MLLRTFTIISLIKNKHSYDYLTSNQYAKCPKSNCSILSLISAALNCMNSTNKIRKLVLSLIILDYFEGDYKRLLIKNQTRSLKSIPKFVCETAKRDILIKHFMSTYKRFFFILQKRYFDFRIPYF